MGPRAEVLVFGCHEDDVAALRNAAGRRGPLVLTALTVPEFTQHVIARRPVAVFLGAGRSTHAHLDVIPVLRAVRAELPVIVVAEEDSLELQRRARESSIFYYLVHPLNQGEVRALLKNVMRRARAW
jgi:DNA-binding response OmpR family regulator